MTRTEWEQQIKELKRKFQDAVPGSSEESAIRRQYDELLARKAELEPEKPVETPTKSTETNSSRTINTKGDYFEHIDGDVHIHPKELQSEDSTYLHETYLRRLLHTTSQLYLTGIDRKAASDDPKTWLNLGAIYVALSTRNLGGSALGQLNRHNRLVLLGDPGSGKSTFVNFVAMCLAGALLKDKTVNLKLLAKNPQEWKHGELLPVLVILRDFAAKGLPSEGEQAKATHLWRFITNTLQENMLGDYEPYLRRHLQEQGGLLLLDGLDEVPEAMKRREQIKQTVEDFVVAFPKCRILVTSRTYAYQQQAWRLQKFDMVELTPFTEEQIRRFVDHWYDHFAEKRGLELADARGKAELLKQAIFQSERLSELAERPLLLTLMASLHAWRGGSLPEKREELYNDTVDLLLDWWESPKVVRDAAGNFIVAHKSLSELLKVGKERVRKALNMMAFQAHHSQPELVGTADIAEEQLIGNLMRFSQDKELRPALLVEYLSERAGLLVPRGVGVYTFPHRTFQEYLAACYLTDDDYPKKIAELARQEVNRWREVLLLAGAKAARGAVSAIWALVEALCWQEVGEVNATPEMAWGALLAGQALAETIDIDQVEEYERPKLERINRWLMAILTKQIPSEQPLPEVERTLADNILAKLDIRLGIGLDENGLPEIDWCEVPAGEFIMGEGPDEHTVNVSAFQISRYPITNVQYQTFVKDGGYTEKWQQCWMTEGWDWKRQRNTIGLERYNNPFYLPNHPVVGVSWYEVSAFCQWLTQRLRQNGNLLEGQEIRLPTEVEWEKAARGDDGRICPWGYEITPEFAHYSDTGLGVTIAVGCFPRGTSPYGCEDMSGNVWEWCKNRWNPSGTNRGLRGGSWDSGAEGCRAACRGGRPPGDRVNNVGFRLVRAPS